MRRFVNEASSVLMRRWSSLLFMPALSFALQNATATIEHVGSQKQGEPKEPPDPWKGKTVKLVKFAPPNTFGIIKDSYNSGRPGSNKFFIVEVDNSPQPYRVVHSNEVKLVDLEEDNFDGDFRHAAGKTVFIVRVPESLKLRGIKRGDIATIKEYTPNREGGRNFLIQMLSKDRFEGNNKEKVMWHGEMQSLEELANKGLVDKDAVDKLKGSFTVMIGDDGRPVEEWMANGDFEETPEDYRVPLMTGANANILPGELVRITHPQTSANGGDKDFDNLVMGACARIQMLLNGVEKTSWLVKFESPPALDGWVGAFTAAEFTLDRAKETPTKEKCSTSMLPVVKPVVGIHVKSQKEIEQEIERKKPHSIMYLALHALTHKRRQKLDDIGDMIKYQLQEKAVNAFKEHNKYVGNIWNMFDGVAYFNDAVRQFREQTMEDDEKTNINMRKDYRKGLLEARLLRDLISQYEAYGRARKIRMANLHEDEDEKHTKQYRHLIHFVEPTKIQPFNIDSAAGGNGGAFLPFPLKDMLLHRSEHDAGNETVKQCMNVHDLADQLRDFEGRVQSLILHHQLLVPEIKKFEKHPIGVEQKQKLEKLRDKLKALNNGTVPEERSEKIVMGSMEQGVQHGSYVREKNGKKRLGKVFEQGKGFQILWLANPGDVKPLTDTEALQDEDLHENFTNNLREWNNLALVKDPSWAAKGTRVKRSDSGRIGEVLSTGIPNFIVQWDDGKQEVLYDFTDVEEYKVEIRTNTTDATTKARAEKAADLCQKFRVTWPELSVALDKAIGSTDDCKSYVVNQWVTWDLDNKTDLEGIKKILRLAKGAERS